MGSVGTHNHVQWLRSWRDISAAKLPPPRSIGSHFHTGIPKPRATETRGRAYIASGGGKISGDSVHLGEKETCWRPIGRLPRVEHFL